MGLAIQFDEISVKGIPLQFCHKSSIEIPSAIYTKVNCDLLTFNIIKLSSVFCESTTPMLTCSVQ